MLAALEYLSVSGLKPTVAGMPCPPSDAGGARLEHQRRQRDRGGLDHRRQRRPRRRSPGPGHPRRHRRAPAADAAGPVTPAAHRQPDALPEHLGGRHERERQPTRSASSSPRRALPRARSRGSPASTRRRSRREQWNRLIARLGQIPDPPSRASPRARRYAVGSSEGGAVATTSPPSPPAPAAAACRRAASRPPAQRASNAQHHRRGRARARDPDHRLPALRRPAAARPTT